MRKVVKMESREKKSSVAIKKGDSVEIIRGKNREKEESSEGFSRKEKWW